MFIKIEQNIKANFELIKSTGKESLHSCSSSHKTFNHIMRVTFLMIRSMGRVTICMGMATIMMGRLEMD